MANENIAELEVVLGKSVSKINNVTSKKMFGCSAFWVNENVFALVWKHGRIGIKLPDEKSYEALLAQKGSEPWKAGPMKMAHWVLVPEKFHADQTELKRWVKKSSEQCLGLEKKVAKKAVKKSGKK